MIEERQRKYGRRGKEGYREIEEGKEKIRERKRDDGRRER